MLDAISNFVSAVWRAADDGDFWPKLSAWTSGLFLTGAFTISLAVAREKVRNRRGIIVVIFCLIVSAVLAAFAAVYAPENPMPPCGKDGKSQTGFCDVNSQGKAWVEIGSFGNRRDVDESPFGILTATSNPSIIEQLGIENESHIPAVGERLQLRPSIQGQFITDELGTVQPISKEAFEKQCEGEQDKNCYIVRKVSPSDLCSYWVVDREDIAGRTSKTVYLELRQGCPEDAL